MTTINPTIEIESFPRKRGEKAGQTVYSVWFWVDGECAHIGHFDTEWEANEAGNKVLKAVELTRQVIRKAI